jgi:hypothetical protein
MGRCLLLLLLAEGAPVFSSAQVPGVAHVVVIGVDGMSPDGVEQAATPFMNRLMAEGAYTFHARAVLPTVSSPNWASMIMGAGPAQHGITSNDWEPTVFTIPPTAQATAGYFPTIFHLLRQQRPEAVSVVVHDWDGFGRLFDPADVTVVRDGEGPQQTTDWAVAEIRTRRPALTFIHLDHVDHAGHADGHGSRSYYDAVAEADRMIGQVLQALYDAGMADSTAVLVTADHGGMGTGHGGESMAELEIPWMLRGPGVVPGPLAAPIDTYDTAATVAHLLGLTRPEAWIARPVLSAFRPRPAATPYVPRPQVLPGGGRFVDTTATVTLVSETAALIRYTLDGHPPGATSPRYERPLTLHADTYLQARAFTPAGDTSGISAATFRFLHRTPGQGVAYAYFEGSWRQLPNFEALTPVQVGTALEFDLADVPVRTERFGVQFTAYVQVPQAGRYRFFLTSDDGARLLVDGAPCVDNDGQHGPRTRWESVDLTAGIHHLRVDYFNGGGGGQLQVAWEGPGMPRQVLSVTALRPRRP